MRKEPTKKRKITTASEEGRRDKKSSHLVFHFEKINKLDVGW